MRAVQLRTACVWSPKRIIKIAAFVISLGVAVYVGVIIVMFFFGSTSIPSPPYPSYDALMTAIGSGHPANVKAVLDRGVDPNVFPNDPASVQNEYDMTPLCAAATDGNTAIIALLLDHHADPNTGDGWYTSPLSAAAMYGKTDAMKLLIARGASVNGTDGTSQALWSAATSGQAAAVSLLLLKGANPRASTDIDGKSTTLLSIVRSQGDPRIAALLVKAGAK